MFHHDGRLASAQLAAPFENEFTQLTGRTSTFRLSVLIVRKSRCLRWSQVRAGAVPHRLRWRMTPTARVLALIAAVVSYRHMYTLVVRHGETMWTAALLPLSVDGMIAASSMLLLLDSRYGTAGVVACCRGR